MRAAILSLLFLLTFTLAFTTEAMAHKLSIFAIADGDTNIRTESYFLDGKPCMRCDVLVYTTDALPPIEKGITDSEGVYIFNNTAHTALRFEVITSTGHASKYLWTPEKSEPITKDQPTEKITIATGTTNISNEELESLIESRVAPLRQEITRLQKAAARPGITEVMGGIGYIIGLFGLLAYFKRRKQDAS